MVLVVLLYIILRSVSSEGSYKILRFAQNDKVSTYVVYDIKNYKSNNILLDVGGEEDYTMKLGGSVSSVKCDRHGIVVMI